MTKDRHSLKRVSTTNLNNNTISFNVGINTTIIYKTWIVLLLFSFVMLSIRWWDGVRTKVIAPTNCDHKRITSVTFQAQCVLSATH